MRARPGVKGALFGRWGYNLPGLLERTDIKHVGITKFAQFLFRNAAAAAGATMQQDYLALVRKCRREASLHCGERDVDDVGQALLFKFFHRAYVHNLRALFEICAGLRFG